MDPSQRANAAQMAARNIKAVKGRRRTPVQSNPNAQQSMSFPGTGGGLFGGSVQATGSFDFSAPAGGLSFPPSTFGGNNNIFGSGAPSPAASENGDDPRADTTGEEDARRKKAFRGPEDSSTRNLFQMSNSFGQSQQGNPFSSTSAQEKPSGGIFSFAQSNPQPASPGFGFSSAPTQDKPANIFPFGAPSSQPTTATPTTNFSSGQSQDKPGNSLFNFAQPASQPAQLSSGSPFNFGSGLQDKSASTPFSFGQASTQPLNPGINFGSTPIAAKSASNIFGNSQPTQSPSSTNIFGSASQQPVPQSNIFANQNTPASPSNNLFGTQVQSPTANTNNLFGGQNQKPASSSTVFGVSNSTLAKPSPSVEQKSRSTSPNNLFGALNKPAEPAGNLFGSPKPTPANNLFGTSTQAASTGDLFGTLNKPVVQAGPEPKTNGKAVNGAEDEGKKRTTESSPSTSSIFSQPPSTNVFSSSKSLFSTPISQAKTPTTEVSPGFSFGSIQSSATTSETSKTLFSTMKPIDAPTGASQPPLSGMFPSLLQSAPDSTSNDTFNASAASTGLTKSTSPPATFSSSSANGSAINGVDHDFLYAEMNAASTLTDEEMSQLVPVDFSEKQKNEFYTAYRMRSLNRAMEKFFGSITLEVGVSKALAFYVEKRTEILDRSSLSLPGLKHKPVDVEDQENENPIKRPRQSEPSNLNSSQPAPERQVVNSPEKVSHNGSQPQPYGNGASTPKPPSFGLLTVTPNTALFSSPTPRGKRKAEFQLTKDDDDEGEEREERRIKTPRFSGSSGGSNTSNIFKSILDSPAKTSPEKKTIPSPKDVVPRENPFGALPVPTSPTKTAASSSTSTTNLFAPKPTSNAVSSFLPALASSAPSIHASASTESNPSVVKPPTFGLGATNFMAQFNKKAKQNEKDAEENLMEKAKAEDMDSDEDEAEWEASWKEKRKAELKALGDIAKNKRSTFVPGKGFTFDDGQKESDSANLSTSGASSDVPSKTGNTAPSQAPTSVFGQNTQSSSNSVFGSRTSTPGPFGSSTGSVLDGHTSGQQPVSFGQNIFGHLSDIDSGADSGKGADEDTASEDSDAEHDSENKDPSYQPGEESGSGPGTPVEETGAGIASAKKPTSTATFMFGSSKLSGPMGDSTSGTSSPGGSLFDRITKDSNGNPVRQISSEEKENTQPSTTTNVFGDIGKNPFGSLNKTAGTPADQTWKLDSPIRFGSAAPTPSNDASNPTVSVTAATPTKAPTSNPFGNLNNLDSTSKPNFSSLFGSSKAPLSSAPSSATVGFNFGQSSGISSLFPSAAASTTTSRATSPGGTTDGDSATEDPDAEKHEQLDLTAGGPGEEDEEVIYEVRAKATKFCAKGEGDTSSPWVAKGLGPLRVLKHRETNACRILLRADPRGTVVLNKALLSNYSYAAKNKIVQIMAAGEAGKGLETWLLQVKTPELAEALAKVLESNKPSG